jgi:hypothetical protein
MRQLCVSSSKGLIGLIAFLLIAGCTIERKPDAILSEAEMARVLTEIYINEEKVVKLNLRRDSAEKIFEMAEPILFKKIGVSDSVFRMSFEYYVERPKQLELIYTAVVDSLNLWEQKLNVAPAAEVKE